MSDSFEWNARVEAINLDTVMAKLHVFHLCDILNAIKSWLWKSADFLVMREIAAVINMQTSSRWQNRLSFENPIYFCVIIYLPVHSLQSRAIPPAHITQLHSHLYLRRRDCTARFCSLRFCLRNAKSQVGNPRNTRRPPRSARARAQLEHVKYRPKRLATTVL